MSDPTPTVGRASRLTARNIINGIVPVEPSETASSPRTSSVSSVDNSTDINVVFNGSKVLDSDVLGGVDDEQGSDGSKDAPDIYFRSL